MNIGKVKKIYYAQKYIELLRANPLIILFFRILQTPKLISNFFYLDTKVILMLSLAIITFGVSFSELSSKFYSYVVSASGLVQTEGLKAAEISGEAPSVNYTSASIKSNAGTIDKRIYVLDEYFKANESPLYGQAKEFVKACDKYKAPKDCITIPAIAKHETNLCKYNISAQMHNCLGWGGSGPNRLRFPDFKTHIDTATRVLVQQYGVEYMINPSLMDSTFCGPQAECIGWGARILSIMKTIDDFGVSLGVGRLSDLR